MSGFRDNVFKHTHKHTIIARLIVLDIQCQHKINLQNIFLGKFIVLKVLKLYVLSLVFIYFAIRSNSIDKENLIFIY